MKVKTCSDRKTGARQDERLGLRNHFDMWYRVAGPILAEIEQFEV